MFPLERRGRRPYSPGHVYHQDAGRDSLALEWNPTVQNAPCDEQEEVRRSLKEHDSIRARCTDLVSEFSIATLECWVAHVIHHFDSFILRALYKLCIIQVVRTLCNLLVS